MRKSTNIEGSTFYNEDGSYFYLTDQEIVSKVVIPLIKKLENGLSADKLDQSISENIRFVFTALFDQELDSKRIATFINELYEKADPDIDAQSKLYESLYRLFVNVTNSPKIADGRFQSYEDAQTNAEYMHLLSLVLENLSVDSVLIGVSSDLSNIDTESGDVL